jgi:S-sulfosulfanyl-L-cysteine sulfohydrolase
MTDRRQFLQAALAASALWGASGLGQWGRLAAQQRLTQDDLLRFDDYGNITLIHVTDIHAQLKPLWFREPEFNLGVGAVRGLPPHITGAAFLDTFGIAPGSAQAYALTHTDFTALAREYGRMGGLDRVATVVNAIRAARPGAILLDGGDTWQGSYTSLQSGGQDMVNAMTLLGVDAMTSHWEWTFGADRVDQIVADLPFPFLGQNVFDAEWDEPALEPYTLFERAGTLVAVIGQAFPYTPIANPAWMFEGLSFGIRDRRMQQMVDEVRAQGAGLVVVLSHNGFDVDRQMAQRVTGIDVILTGHTHDAIPEPVMVGQTLLIASGSHGKFVTRLDLQVDGGLRGFRHRLIPVFSDAIAPDPAMAALIEAERAPHAAHLAEVVGQTEGLLYRRGNFGGTWDRLICDAIIDQRDVEIALSPGVRWGASVMPGPITREDIHNATSMTYGQCYRSQMSGAQIALMLEDIADNLFNPDPYYQQGGDMVRMGGLAYAIDVNRPMGSRISDLTLTATGDALDPARSYSVGGWASVTEGVEGPMIWDVVEDHIRARGTVRPDPEIPVRVTDI